MIALFDPVFTAARIFGTLALLALGLLGLFLLPLWPLVYAVELLVTAAGAAFIALFGLGWVGLGMALIARGQVPSGTRGSARRGQA